MQTKTGKCITFCYVDNQSVTLPVGSFTWRMTMG